jgi:hypothetical protein
LVKNKNKYYFIGEKRANYRVETKHVYDMLNYTVFFEQLLQPLFFSDISEKLG